ncbi:RNA-binding (RRM/RBD/RNP motifs) family protein [Zea mays]|uniref:RNA-binding (RRM/RBD/RNP motifs) family protein n=1 Tax=Zea mays TaxID=4577 RepID=A0A1D6G7N1_MAIZE|nr:RNA-binding (RRM/RBD/RNP motifs) family protein [Zea mays]AQK99161.1 RNA-binding (RRM/RBD/RNP motifs) family protein [Zea mays]
MSPPSVMGQFGDTTYTKVFVGGLAWETQKETMRKYFEQFGEILEAVVITDKNTGRSKGYGFVTFRDSDAAMRACVDPAPVIDGRRANCNLASLGVQRSRPPTPQHGGARNFKVMKSFSQQAGIQGGLGAAFPSHATFPHYAIPQGLPYHIYGYSPYTLDYGYPTCVSPLNRHDYGTRSSNHANSNTGCSSLPVDSLSVHCSRATLGLTMVSLLVIAVLSRFQLVESMHPSLTPKGTIVDHVYQPKCSHPYPTWSCGNWILALAPGWAQSFMPRGWGVLTDKYKP